jgi:hypothetical protein
MPHRGIAKAPDCSTPVCNGRPTESKLGWTIDAMHHSLARNVPRLGAIRGVVF